MVQLVGSSCVHCQKSIESIAEGEFCSSCDSPYHHQCRDSRPPSTDPTRCSTCGGDVSELLAEQARDEQAATLARDQAPTTRVQFAIFTLEMVALLLFVFAVWFSFTIPSRDPNRELALYFIGTLVGFVVFIQFVVYGLFKGKNWARLAGIALLILSVPSVVLPLAIVSLVLLANKNSWDEYVRCKCLVEDGE